jgi:WD40 repeat protein
MRQLLSALAGLAVATAALAQETTDGPYLVANTGGHTARVNRVLFTPDGKRLVSVSNDKTIRIWDLTTGATVRVLRPPIGKGAEGALYAAALSPDGKTLAVGGLPPGASRDGTPIYIITLASGRIERLLDGHKSTIADLAFSADGKRLASASMDKTVRIWDPFAGTCEKTLEGHTGPVLAVAWNPDGDRLVTGSTDKTARIWSVESSETVAVLKGHQREVRCVAWSRDGKSIATGGSDQTLRIWEPDGKIRSVYEKLGNHISSVTFTAKCRGVLYTRGSAEYTDNTCTVLNIVTGKDYSTFDKHSNTVMHGALSPDNTLAATCGGLAHEIYVWKVTGGEVQQRLVGGARAILSAAWDATGSTFAWGTTNKGSTIRADMPLERTFRLADLDFGPPPPAGAFARTQTARDALTLEPIGHSGLAVKNGASTLKSLMIASELDRVRCYSFLAADRVVIGSSLGLDLYDTTTGARIRTLQGHADEVWAVAPAPNRRWVLSASLDQTLRLWDAEALLRSEPLGIGLIFRMEAGYPVVTGTVPGSVSAKDGRLKEKDKIVAIASRGSAFTDVHNKTAADVVGLLTGPDGSVLRLKVVPDGQEEPVEYELQRQPIAGWVPRSEPLLSLFIVDNDWVAWTPEGYYAASPGGEKLMGWQVNNGRNRLGTFYPMERFAASLYRPDIIGRILETGSVDRAIALADLVRGTKTERTEVAHVLPPKVQLQVAGNPQPIVETNDDEIEVIATAQMTGSHTIRALRLLVDGRPYQGSKGMQRYVAPGLKQAKHVWKVVLTPGRHRLVAQADSDVSQGDSEALEVTYAVGTQQHGRLFVLAVGIAAYPDDNLRLEFAAKDASAIATRLKEKGMPKPFQNVKVQTLTNKQATRNAILKQLEVLQKEVKPEDNVLIFYSGHGERDPDGKLYLLPHDVDVKKLADTGISGDELKAALIEIRGQVMLVLDACHAGAVGVSGQLTRELGRDENGIIMLCSSTARQRSQENNEGEHGAFTRAMLEGLAGKGSKSSDGIVYEYNLNAYVIGRVRDLTGGQQTPTQSMPINVPHFPLTKP